MRRIVAFATAVSVLLILVVTPAHATAPQAQAHAKKFSVGIVLDVGGVNDKSFNHLAYLGLLEAGKKYGIKGEYVVSRGPTDYVPNLTHFAQLHVGLVVAVGFLQQSAIYIVAKQYPNQKFAMVDGQPNDAKGNPVILKNVANLFFKEQESGYLVGYLSGLMEKGHVGRATHGTIGYMGGLSIPPVNRYIAGYVAGAKAADPGIRILGGYSQSFTNQAAGKAIGLAQVSQGADILFQVAGSSGLGYLAAAQERGDYGIGVDADQGYLGSYIITSAVKRVDVAVADTIRDAKTGRFRGGTHQFSLKNHATGFAKPSSAVPASIVKKVKGIEKLIASGRLVPSTAIPAH